MTKTAETAKPIRILALCDSIVTRPGNSLTGFGRVALNLFSRWRRPDADGSGVTEGLLIDVWAIGFDGHGYKAAPPHCTLIPAGNQQWNTPERLNAFLRQLAHGNYTHVFILMDPDAISHGNFPAELRRVCREKKIRSLLYYPVDAPLVPPFEIISVVDVAVTFTDYGAEMTKRQLKYRSVEVIPHGIDSHFKPVVDTMERERYRAEFQVPGKDKKPKPFLAPGDFLIVNINKNEWRKDPLRSLEILKGLWAAGIPAKLVMRMSATSLAGGIHLERAAEQLGLTLDKEWAHIGPVPESHMRALYAAADLYLTTSLGEGWGLGVTEALACGTPVAVPMHTSLAEIGHKVEHSRSGMIMPAVKFLPLESGVVCGYDTRLRHRVDLPAAVQVLKSYFQSAGGPVQLAPEILDWLNWDRVAAKFLKLMNISQP